MRHRLGVVHDPEPGPPAEILDRPGDPVVRDDRRGRHRDDCARQRRRDFPSADVQRDEEDAVAPRERRGDVLAPLDTRRGDELVRARERPQEVGGATRLVPYLSPDEVAHDGILRRASDRVREVLRETPSLARPRRPLQRAAHGCQRMGDRRRKAPSDGTRREDRSAQGACRERAAPEPGVVTRGQRRGSSESSVSVTASW